MRIDGLHFLPVMLCLFIPFLLYLRPRHRTQYLMYAGLMYLYLTGLVYYTLLPVNISRLQSPDMSRYIETVPFNHYVHSAFLLNILLTIPLGLLYPMVWRHSQKRSLLLLAIASPLIEGSQFLLHFVSDPYSRVIDVTDLIANTMGVLIGLVLFYTFRGFYGEKKLDRDLQRLQQVLTKGSGKRKIVP